MARAALDFKRLLPFDIWKANDLRLYSEICWNGLKNYPVEDTAVVKTNQNYPGYDSLYKRTLVSIGFNWPTHPLASYTIIPGVAALCLNNNFSPGTLISGGVGIIAGTGIWLLQKWTGVPLGLDLLSLEAEYWNNDFANSYWGVFPTGGGYLQNPNPWTYQKSIDKGARIDPYGGPWHWSVYAKKTLFKNAKLIVQVSRDHTILETTLTGMANGDPQEAMDGLGNWGWMSKVEFGF
jgi:hypothetical protein